jgi:hypothetical protein
MLKKSALLFGWRRGGMAARRRIGPDVKGKQWSEVCRRWLWS